MEEDTSLAHIYPSTSSSSSDPPTSSSSSSSSSLYPPHLCALLPPSTTSSSSIPPSSTASTSSSSSFVNGIEEDEEGRGGRLRRRKRTVTQESRLRRRKPRPGESWCPVCGVTLRPGELEAHLTHELDKLARLPHARPPSQRTTPPAPNSAAATPASTSASTTTCTAAPSTSSATHTNGEIRGGRVRGAGRGCDWEKYERIRTSRERRLGRRGRRGAGGEEVTCPVCGMKEGEADPTEDIHQHIDNCLRRVEEEGEDEMEVEVEEYEWCGETRIRATQMLRAEGQLHALGTRVEHGSEDEVVEVCEDEEEAQYGASQFTDADLPPRTDSPQTHLDGHAYPTATTDSMQRHTDQIQTTEEGGNCAEGRNKEENGNTEYRECRDREREDRIGSRACDINEAGRSDCHAASSSSFVRGDDGGSGAVVQALRERVRELESACERPHHSTCRVCHDDYEAPLVSVSCWHVHCRACWLSALANRRLCPQCSVITGPSDLRRIYL